MRVLAFLAALLFGLPAWAVVDVLEPSDLDPVTQAIEGLKLEQAAQAERLLKLEAKDVPPKPEPGNPYADLAENAWRHVGPSISSVWADLDPRLDPLTLGRGGLRSIVNQFCGAGWLRKTKSFLRSCGGHSANGYNRAYRYNVEKLTVEWASPDVRLDHPALTNACPYPSEIGPEAGPASNHWYDGIITMPDGNTFFFPETAYDCMGKKNREPARVWKLSPEGDWSIAHDRLPKDVSATATAALPDGKILTLSRHYQAIFDPATGEYVKVDRYAGLGGFGNLIAAGESEPGVLRFFWFDYNQHLYRILVHKNEDGEWAVGWPVRLVDKVAPWYTSGAVWLPDQQAVMFWNGGRTAKFVLLDREEPEVRVVEYPEIRDPGDSKFHIHESGMQYIPEWDVVVTLGPAHTDGIHVFRPPSDLRAATEPAPPPKLDLQPIVDAAQSGAYIRLEEARYGPALIKTADLTIECAPGTKIEGQRQSQGALVLAAPRFTLRGCEVSAGHNNDNNASAVWGSDGSGGGTFESNHFKDSDNGILTSKKHGGTYVVRNNTFTNLGAGGRGHAFYDSSSRTETIIENNVFQQPKGDGHLIKSRAAKTTIRGNQILGNTEPDQPSYSRLIDLPNGGHIVIEGNTMRHGHPPGNNDAVCIGCEYGDPRPGSPVEDNSVLIRGNVVEGFGGPSRFLNVNARYPDAVPIDPEQIERDNQITGFGKIVSDGR